MNKFVYFLLFLASSAFASGSGNSISTMRDSGSGNSSKLIVPYSNIERLRAGDTVFIEDLSQYVDFQRNASDGTGIVVVDEELKERELLPK